MKHFFGIWTVAVALTVSVVAAYYSIIGLTAIFAAAAIPVIIMGASLEVAKITTAIWLHSFWHEAPGLMKLYLTSATLILMLITSMGIFGFLSKAHIEQSASSGELSARIERIDQEIDRRNETINRANLTIENFSSRVSDADNSIQTRIGNQERLITNIEERLIRDINVQNDIINQELRVLEPLHDELSIIEQQRQKFTELVAANNVVALQTLIGTTPDGVYGSATAARAAQFEQELNSRRSEILNELERLQTTNNEVVTNAQARIQDLQRNANEEINKAQSAINSFRDQLISITVVDNTDDIVAQELIIQSATNEIDTLLGEKFELQAKVRQIEVEVGPIKYIAELIYGDANPDLLEDAVRWMIILLVLVFDPLAVILILAGVSIMRSKPASKFETNTGHTIPEPEPISTPKTEVKAGAKLRLPTINKSKPFAKEPIPIPGPVPEQDPSSMIAEPKTNFLRVAKIDKPKG